jgi:hypothetical protein
VDVAAVDVVKLRLERSTEERRVIVPILLEDKSSLKARVEERHTDKHTLIPL